VGGDDQIICYPVVDDLIGEPGDAYRRSARATWGFERIFILRILM